LILFSVLGNTLAIAPKWVAVIIMGIMSANISATMAVAFEFAAELTYPIGVGSSTGILMSSQYLVAAVLGVAGQLM